MAPLPAALGLLFGLTTALTVGLFVGAARGAGRVLLLLLPWLGLQAALALGGFYLVTNTLPPRFGLLLGPPVVGLGLLFATARGHRLLSSLRLDLLTLLHVVRIPVELVLYWLALHRAVPQLMTFEGRNWDILAGLSAPVLYYLVFRKKWLGRKALLGWNFLGLASLIHIVGTAILSAPSPFQRLAFEQPNVAILHFPFVWLPACVVPLVLLAHLAAVRQLLPAHAAAVPPHVRQRGKLSALPHHLVP